MIETSDLPPTKLQYEEPVPVTHEEVLRVLREGTDEEIERTLVAVALLDEDFDFGLSVIVQSATSNKPGVRGTAILCLGHLARIHRRMPKHPTGELVQAALEDEDVYVRGQAENAADDLELFVPNAGWVFRR